MGNKYQCDYTATQQVWGDVRLTADDEMAAQEMAILEIGQMYPEYDDIVIERIEEVDSTSKEAAKTRIN